MLVPERINWFVKTDSFFVVLIVLQTLMICSAKAFDGIFKDFCSPYLEIRCIFSDDDTTLRGSGELIVNGNFKNGISSKNDIKIKDLTLTVNAANTGIRGKDSVQINSGKITVVADNDGIKASQTEKEGKGFVEINGGTVDITAGDDAVQAVLKITVNAGKVSASVGGKSFNCEGEVYTAEGTFTEK